MEPRLVLIEKDGRVVGFQMADERDLLAMKSLMVKYGSYFDLRLPRPEDVSSLRQLVGELDKAINRAGG